MRRFTMSVFYLVHGLALRPEPNASDAFRTAADLTVPTDIGRLQGRARVDAQFWPSRVQTTTERGFETRGVSADLTGARDLMRQLGIVGEIQWPAAQPTNGPFAFQVTPPGLVVDVKADLQSRRATLQRTD